MPSNQLRIIIGIGLIILPFILGYILIKKKYRNNFEMCTYYFLLAIWLSQLVWFIKTL